MTTSDARKRNADRGMTFAEAADLIKARMPRSLATPDQENPMTKHDRHDELKALLSKISEESVSTSNVLADVLDLLRERMPEPEVYHCIACGENYPTKRDHDCPTPDGKPEPAEVTEDQPVGTRIVDRWGDLHHRLDGGWGCLHGCCLVPFDRLPRPLRLATPADLARVGIEDEPAPAGDLPGEPVEPGDLRAGDRVTFKWGEECITSTLVSSYDGEVLRSDTPRPSGYTPNVIWCGRWAGGISDVRLIERAPREDEHDPDEALAEALRKAYSTGDWLDVARVARERIEAEQEDAVSFLREEVESLTARAEKAERALDNATQRVLDLTAERDEWNTLAHEADRNAKRHHDRAEKAEAERDDAARHADRWCEQVHEMRDERDGWKVRCEKAEAEAAFADERDRHDATITERDALRERLDALRADVERFSAGDPLITPLDILARDDERAAKGGQR